MHPDQRQARRYLRTPTPSPDASEIAFIHAGDIWIVPTQGGHARRLTSPRASHWGLRWSRNGQYIACTSDRSGQGDIYVLPVEEGAEVRRLTAHGMGSDVEDWAADDQSIYFSSAREQAGSALYRVNLSGGTPIRWISQLYEQLGDLAVSPDGTQLAMAVIRSAWWRRSPTPSSRCDIWLCENVPDPSDLRRISPSEYSYRWPMWSANGQGLYVVSERNGIENIWLIDLQAGNERQITDFRDGRVLWPSISADGRMIVFERDFGLWRMNTRSRRVTPIDVKLPADKKNSSVFFANYSRELTELALAPDGKKLAFVVRGEVFLDFADKETDKDLRQGNSFRVTSTSAREGDVAWAPNSRHLVYISDRDGHPEVYGYDALSHAEKRLTQSVQSKRSPLYSPNGAWIAYLVDEREIHLIEVAAGHERILKQDNLAFYTGLAWSPDSRWLVFIATDENSFENLYVQAIDSDQAHQITFLSNLVVMNPLWAANGQFIICTSGHYRTEMQIVRVDLRPIDPFFREAEFDKLFEQRNGKGRSEQPEAANDSKSIGPDEPVLAQASPPLAVSQLAPQAEDEHVQPHVVSTEPTKEIKEEQKKESSENPQAERPPIQIVFENIQRRTYLLTPLQMDARAMAISHDSRDLLFRATIAGKNSIWTMALDEPRIEQAPRQITASGGTKFNAQFAPDNKSFYFLDSGQIAIRKFPTGDQTMLPVTAEVSYNFHQEKLQVFGEYWRLLRDYFYDPSFGGVDWEAIGAQYLPYVEGSQTPGDLHALLRLMSGELRSSHLGIVGRGMLYINDGYIGLLFDAALQLSEGRLRVSEVLPESPAARVGVQVGDELLAINDHEIEAHTNIDELLGRSVERRVRLRIASAENNGVVRVLAVRPVDLHSYSKLRYRAWVQSNEAYVHRVSTGRLGYVHIAEMSYEAYQQFLTDLDTEAYGKEGVVIDVRFNHGGHTASFLLDVLTRRSMVLSARPGRRPIDSGQMMGNRVLDRPTVLITNEHTASNAESFTETYRRMGLGPVVGRPTAGEVISTSRMPLLDGSIMLLPHAQVMTLDGENLEGKGRPVDVDVPLPLGASARGIDTQIDAAVAALLGRIDQPVGNGQNI